MRSLLTRPDFEKCDLCLWCCCYDLITLLVRRVKLRRTATVAREGRQGRRADGERGRAPGLPEKLQPTRRGLGAK